MHLEHLTDLEFLQLCFSPEYRASWRDDFPHFVKTKIKWSELTNLHSLVLHSPLPTLPCQLPTVTSLYTHGFTDGEEASALSCFPALEELAIEELPEQRLRSARQYTGMSLWETSGSYARQAANRVRIDYS